MTINELWFLEAVEACGGRPDGPIVPWLEKVAAIAERQRLACEARLRLMRQRGGPARPDEGGRA